MLKISYFARVHNKLHVTYQVDDKDFEAVFCYYHTVDFDDLEKRFGLEFMERLYFHIIAFEATKLQVLTPSSIDWGVFAKYATNEFTRFWHTITHNVWTQWRYENNTPHYNHPIFAISNNHYEATTNKKEGIETLMFVGGGKDSLLAMDLLERSHIPYDTFAYSHINYGPSQLMLIDKLIDNFGPTAHYDMSITGTKTEGNMLVETIGSIFNAIPYALQNGYRYFALAHERSAEREQLTWDVTGEKVNHQWGKSFGTEQIINQYIQTQLVSNLTCFSPIRPVYDVVIFNMIRGHPAVKDTHSCNISKPWCGQCPKCAYVWINYKAYSVGWFALDMKQNKETFLRLLGLKGHVPFECVGHKEETQLAFAVCNKREFLKQKLDLNVQEAIDVYTTVDRRVELMPSYHRNKIVPLLEQGALDARKFLISIFD